MQISGSNAPYNVNAITTLSTHYQAQSNTSGTGNVDDMSVCIRREYSTLYIGDARYDNADDFKSYLAQQYAAGTPVTVWYILANEQTAVVNEPLMKIGVYADSISMEQTGIEIPTINGSNTLDVLTTVKPSEVYIKYKGEPVAGSQTSSQSSAYAPAEVSSQSESIDDINSNLTRKEEEIE